MPCFFLSKRNTPNHINEKCKLISKLYFLRSLQRKGHCVAATSAKWWFVISRRCLDCWCHSPDHNQWASTLRWVGMAFCRALLLSSCVSHCRDCRTKLLGRLFLVKMSLTSWTAEKKKKNAYEKTRAQMPGIQSKQRKCLKVLRSHVNIWTGKWSLMIHLRTGGEMLCWV